MTVQKTKIYKRRLYWLSTKDTCGQLAIDQDGYVYPLDCAPCYKKFKEKKLSEVLNILKYKKLLLSCKQIDEDIDPF